MTDFTYASEQTFVGIVVGVLLTLLCIFLGHTIYGWYNTIFSWYRNVCFGWYKFMGALQQLNQSIVNLEAFLLTTPTIYRNENSYFPVEHRKSDGISDNVPQSETISTILKTVSPFIPEFITCVKSGLETFACDCSKEKTQLNEIPHITYQVVAIPGFGGETKKEKNVYDDGVSTTEKATNNDFVSVLAAISEGKLDISQLLQSVRNCETDHEKENLSPEKDNSLEEFANEVCKQFKVVCAKGIVESESKQDGKPDVGDNAQKEYLKTDEGEDCLHKQPNNNTHPIKCNKQQQTE